jgi:hypothetical protein
MVTSARANTARWSIPLLLSVCFALFAKAGQVETLDHQKYQGEVHVAENGALVIRVAGEQQEQVSLEQVRFARVNTPLFEPGTLPKGWRIEDIGNVSGTVDETNSLFTLHVTGGRTGRDSKAQMAEFAYRVMRGDGEVIARVQSVDGKEPCLAGVTLRDTLDPYSALSLLAVTPDHHLRFDYRENGWQPIEKHDCGPVTMPIWLKLVRAQKLKEKDPFVHAWSSRDGTHWQKVGQTKLAWKSEPVPENSDNWQPRLYAGITLTGPGTNQLWSARMDQVAMIAHGLMGEYFADDRFHNRRFVRADEHIDFDWGVGSPGPGIEEDHFSIRWSGKLEPEFSEAYRFYFDADNEAKLWIGGEELPQVAFKTARPKSAKIPQSYTGRELLLKAGQQYDVKLEFKEGNGAALVRLGWSSPSVPIKTIPSSQLSCAYNANFPDDDDRASITNAIFAKGLWLRNGTYLAGEITACDDSATQIAWPGQKQPLVIPNTKIGHIVLRLSRRGFALSLAENHTGVFVKTGDFLEAEFVGLKGRSLVVNSLLFGRRSFSLDDNNAIALVLNQYAPARARFEIKLMNGSVLRANTIRATRGQVVATDSLLGDIAFPEAELLEILNTGSRQ